MSRDAYERILAGRFRLEDAISNDEAVNIHGAGVDLPTLRAGFTYDAGGQECLYEVTIRELEALPA